MITLKIIIITLNYFVVIKTFQFTLACCQLDQHIVLRAPKNDGEQQRLNFFIILDSLHNANITFRIFLLSSSDCQLSFYCPLIAS